MIAARHISQPRPPVGTALPTAGAAEQWVECVDIVALAAHEAAWNDLCARALEPNIFLDPSFALPLFQHGCASHRSRVLLVWNGPTRRGRLLGLFVLDLPHRRAGMARIHVHEQTSSGTPLIDRAEAGHVIETALRWLAARSKALVISDTVGDGAFANMLRTACASSSRQLVTLEERSRAVLNRPLDEHDDGRVASFASARRRKQYARQARRLAKKGERALTCAKTPAELAAATERFLTLEYESWKGARGTALLANPVLATFARTMTRTMGRDGRCRIEAVEIDGRAVAMGIILTDRGRAHFWKIAFDENYSAFSPGVQLSLELTRKQLADPLVSLTDSCAEANHPMIDRLWPDRSMMVDLMVALDPGRSLGFAFCLRIERIRRAMRQAAKIVWIRLRRARRN